MSAPANTCAVSGKLRVASLVHPLRLENCAHYSSYKTCGASDGLCIYQRPAEPKTCLGCGAKFTTIPEGGLPCGH